MTSRAGRPPIRALVKSANIVGEWLPKMMMSSTSVIGTPAFWASWVRARFWSRRVMAVKRSGPSRRAWAAAIMQLVLQGLPTTTTRASSEATSSMALALLDEDLAVVCEQLGPLHAGAARLAADEDAPVRVREGLARIVGQHHPLQEREGAVVELHGHPAQGLLGPLGGDLQQLQDDRPVRSERLPRRDAGEDGVADLPRGAGHGDPQGRRHAATFSFSMMASATSEVPTAVGSSRWGFMS